MCSSNSTLHRSNHPINSVTNENNSIPIDSKICIIADSVLAMFSWDVYYPINNCSTYKSAFELSDLTVVCTPDLLIVESGYFRALGTGDTDSILKIRNSHMAKTLQMLLVLHANLNFFKNSGIGIRSAGSNVCFFIYANTCFITSMTFLDTFLSYLGDVSIRRLTRYIFTTQEQ